MSKIITGLMLIWLVVITVTGCFSRKAEVEFLQFADMVIDDNIKNVVKSGGGTFLVVDMGNVTMPGLTPDIRLWSPIYVNEKDLDKIIDWKRKQVIMVRDFKNINFQSPIIAAQAERYFKKRLDNLEIRKLTPKQKAALAEKRKRNSD